MNSPQITGHKTQRALLEKLLFKDTLPHALLFSGPAGIGKRQSAYELAQKIFKSSGIAIPLTSNPDFKEIDCQDRTAINAENIRELLYSLNLNSFLAGRRIVLLNNAEYIPLQSANILLKSLEEPRKDTHFILVAANPYRLPYTLLSRCQLIHFNPLNAKEIDSIVGANPEFEECRKIISDKNIKLHEISNFSQGSFENLNALINNFDNWLLMRDEMNRIRSGDTIAAVSLSERLAKDKDNLRLNIRLLAAILKYQMYSSETNSDYELIAAALTSLTISEKLIFERNISAAYILNFIFSGLARKDTANNFADLDEDVSMLANL